jgi:plastocyanin
MKNQRAFAIGVGALLLPLLVGSLAVTKGKERNADKYVCSETNPEAICNASTTCGSASDPCTADIKRTANAASVTPSIPKAKGNKPFCVRVGTTVKWQSKSKNTGFVLDFGSSSPFDQTTILGGSDRSVSLVARKAGCYKFSVGACTPGSIYGMCSQASGELIVTAADD